MARHFKDMSRLATSFFFLRGKKIKRESHRFFATLSRDLSEHYPAFKVSLGEAIQNNTQTLYIENYPTLFESLL